MPGRTIARLLAASAIVLLMAAARGAAQEQPASRAEQIAHRNDCFSCHAVDHDIVGPAFVSIARRYRDTPLMARMLASKVIHGSAGDFGITPMPPHPNLSPADALILTKWILSTKGKLAREIQRYSYKTSDGKSVLLGFKVFEDESRLKVTGNIAQGFQKYDNFCSRCHGIDAEGGSAPNLPRALQSGMTRKDFLTVTMEGLPQLGMPKWAGALSAEELSRIYEYLKARSVGLVAAGAPPGVPEQ